MFFCIYIHIEKTDVTRQRDLSKWTGNRDGMDDTLQQLRFDDDDIYHSRKTTLFNVSSIHCILQYVYTVLNKKKIPISKPRQDRHGQFLLFHS